MCPVCDLVGRFLCRPARSLFRADCLLGSENAGPPSPGGESAALSELAAASECGRHCVSSLVAAWPLVLTPLLYPEGPCFLCGLAVEMQELDLLGGGGLVACPPVALSQTQPLLSQPVPRTPAVAHSVITPVSAAFGLPSPPSRVPFVSDLSVSMSTSSAGIFKTHVFKCPCKVSAVSPVSGTGGTVIVTLTPLSSHSVPEPPWGLF